jgi:hypothetical protein
MMQQKLTLKCNFEDVLPLLCGLDMCVKSPEVESASGVNEERAPV